jgi:hypothetical protein
MPPASLAAINLECTDPVVLAHFWARMLEGEVVIETPAYCAVKVGALLLGAARVEGYQPPTWPAPDRSQQIHLDVAVGDLDAAEREAIELGATKEHDQPTPDRSRVLRAPAGHPFCLRA